MDAANHQSMRSQFAYLRKTSFSKKNFQLAVISQAPSSNAPIIIATTQSSRNLQPTRRLGLWLRNRRRLCRSHIWRLRPIFRDRVKTNRKPKIQARKETVRLVLVEPAKVLVCLRKRNEFRSFPIDLLISFKIRPRSSYWYIFNLFFK